jgi:1-phosphofructokinase
MIATITLNTAIDHILFVPEFRLGETIRSTRSYLSMGGKGTDVSYILGTLGIENLALGFKAGVFGDKMEAMLQERNVQTDFVQVGGETRISTLIIEQGAGQSTFTVDTLQITPEHIEEFFQHFEAALGGSGCVVIGGTPPSSFPLDEFSDLIRLANERSIPTVLDASGESLQAAVAARPTVIKPNLRELEDLAGQSLTSPKMVAGAAREIMNTHGCSVIATMGERGALAVLPGGTYHIAPLEIEVVNSAGAGDAVFAGLAYALDQHIPLEDGLRLGFAAAAAVMLTPRTADCEPAQVERFRSQVVLEPFLS